MNSKNKTRKETLLSRIDDELARTIAAYESLIIQSRQLSDSMGYSEYDVLCKVMPKTAAQRTDTERIIDWYEEHKENAVERILFIEEERERETSREHLIASLKLTDEQRDLLGL